MRKNTTKPKVGNKVGAMFVAKGGTVEFLGYGIYEGDFIPEEAAGWMAEGLRNNKVTNPRIRLDNGKIVYGCECWWGDADRIKKELEKYETVVDVDIDEIRSKNK